MLKKIATIGTSLVSIVLFVYILVLKIIYMDMTEMRFFVTYWLLILAFAVCVLGSGLLWAKK